LPSRKLSATAAIAPGNCIFLSYIAVPDRLDSSRVLRFGNEFKVQSSKLIRRTIDRCNFEL
jgi:hypothetical protein